MQYTLKDGTKLVLKQMIGGTTGCTGCILSPDNKNECNDKPVNNKNEPICEENENIWKVWKLLT